MFPLTGTSLPEVALVSEVNAENIADLRRNMWIVWNQAGPEGIFGYVADKQMTENPTNFKHTEELLRFSLDVSYCSFN